jgi:hypothetical protein
LSYFSNAWTLAQKLSSVSLVFFGGSVETTILTGIDSILGDPRGLWSPKEYPNQPSNLDKILNYLIAYNTSAPISRRALRLFKGIDTLNMLAFTSWNEVRVSTLRDIQEVLLLAGAKSDSWDLAITIKDFLQNLFDTLVHCDLDDITEKEVCAYLDQLQGKPWEKDEISPFRPSYSSWSRKNARLPGETVLPEPVLMYLKFLLGKTKYAPFDYHSEKVLTRLGLMKESTPYQAKRDIYNQLLGTEKPISKHRKIVEFSKLVCLKRQPRCGICPFKNSCHYNKRN